MILKFKSLYYKNLQSVGEMGITIDLDRHPTTLIGGDNGSGKSNMLEALSYCLFGKTMKKLKLEKIINSVNKKGLVTSVVFETRGKEYTILRGQKPNKFEIWEDGNQLDKDATASEQQKRLESIIGMDYKLFVQIVVLNTERYTPFMELAAADRRHVVENILDIGVFAEMNRLAKDKIKSLGLEIDDLEYRRGILKEKINSQDKLIEQAKEANENWRTDIQEMIDGWVNQKNNHLINLDDVKEKMKDHEGKVYEPPEIEGVNGKLHAIVSDAERIKKDVKFFEDHDTCPTCDQHIEKHGRQCRIEDGNEEIDGLRSQAKELVAEKKRLEKERDEVLAAKNELNELVREYKSLNQEIKNCDVQIERLQDKMNEKTEDKTDEYVEKRRELASELDEAERRMNTLLDQKASYTQAQKALKDDGIKAEIVREYIDYINQKLNEYLQEMGFFINIMLDENFNESVTSINRDGFVYENFSKGQRCRINLAIWLALLEVASVKNSVVTNVLFLDEVLENLDADGVQLFMKLVDEKMSHKNIFVITQRFEEFKDYFRSDIRFRLDNGFTVKE